MVMDNNALVIRKLMFHMQGRNNKIVPAVVGLTGIGKTAIISTWLNKTKVTTLFQFQLT